MLHLCVERMLVRPGVENDEELALPLVRLQ